MRKHPRRLSRSFVERVQEVGRYGDGRGGHGLTLMVRPKAGGGLRKGWLQRLTIDGELATIGLGSFPIVTLGMARDAALANRQAVWQGRDPRVRNEPGVLSFDVAAERVIQEHLGSWKNGDSTAAEWRQMFNVYSKPLMKKRIDAIGTADVLDVLRPIWNEKRPTAKLLRQRIGTVLKWAMAHGLRHDNPAGDAIAEALPKNGHRIVHRKALPFGRLPEAIEAMREVPAAISTKLAMEFLILTAARSGEIRKARWDEIDWASHTWTLPPERMKTGKEHRVPLSSGALVVLAQARELKDGSGLVFPGPNRQSGMLSDKTLGRLVSRANLDAVPHGMRSSFRDWAAECSDIPSEIVEHALAHVEGSASERAYRRTDYFERRRTLMQDWSDYLGYPSAQGRMTSWEAMGSWAAMTMIKPVDGIGSQVKQHSDMVGAKTTDSLVEEHPNARKRMSV